MQPCVSLFGRRCGDCSDAPVRNGMPAVCNTLRLFVSNRKRHESPSYAVLDDLLPGARVQVSVSCASGTRLDIAEKNCLARHLPHKKVLTPKPVLGEALACSAMQRVITGFLRFGSSAVATLWLRSSL